MIFLARIVLLLAVLVYGASALAHVAPAVRENNRYLKLVLLGDRIRVTYTVYMGEVPGAEARAKMDTNSDGTIAAEESAPFAAELGAALTEGLELRVDGEAMPLTWTETHLGLGARTTNEGSFAVDYVSWACLAAPLKRDQHSVVLFDRSKIPNPGESELRAEESPGVRVTRSTLGDRRGPSELFFSWKGEPGPTESEGYYLDFSVDPEKATIASDELCPAAGTDAESPSRMLALGLLAGLVLVLVTLVAWWTRRGASTVG